MDKPITDTAPATAEDKNRLENAPELDAQTLDGQKVPEESLKAVTGGMRAFAS